MIAQRAEVIKKRMDGSEYDKNKIIINKILKLQLQNNVIINNMMRYLK